MKTVETKISKSGATIYYVDGKRTSRENAMFIQRMNEREACWLAKIEADTAEVKTDDNVTVGTPVEAMALIERITNDTFEFYSEFDKYLLHGENGEKIFCGRA